MLAEFGYGVLVVSFALAIYAIGAAIYGQSSKSQKWVESSRLAMQLTFPMISLGALSLIYLLVQNLHTSRPLCPAPRGQHPLPLQCRSPERP